MTCADNATSVTEQITSPPPPPTAPRAAVRVGVLDILPGTISHETERARIPSPPTRSASPPLSSSSPSEDREDIDARDDGEERGEEGARAASTGEMGGGGECDGECADARLDAAHEIWTEGTEREQFALTENVIAALCAAAVVDVVI